MKFYVPALCLAGGLLAAGAAQAADKVIVHRETHVVAPGDTKVIVERDRAHVTKDGYVVFLGEPLYHRINFYPDLPSEAYVAGKLADLITKQREEIAHLTAFAHGAEQTGWVNIETTYEVMARDHQRLVNMAAEWMDEHGFTPPPAPQAVTVANISAPESVDHMLMMHQKGFEETLTKREGEASSTVRGMLLFAAATTLKHIDWLRTLDRIVDFGEKNVTALLRSKIQGDFFATATEADLNALIAEESTYLRITTTSGEVTYPVIEHVVEVPVETIREVIVERPVERIVEKEVIKEVIVEKPIYVPRSAVAGQRQTTPRRRPAK